MKVTYGNKHMEKVCTDYGIAKKEYGIQIARKLFERIKQMETAESVEWLIEVGIGRCHPLGYDRENQYAMDLNRMKRVVFEKRDDGLIRIVCIMEIVDYHKGG